MKYTIKGYAVADARGRVDAKFYQDKPWACSCVFLRRRKCDAVDACSEGEHVVKAKITVEVEE